MKSIFLEALLIVTGGALLAFAANALSPHGLELRRNYFPVAQGTNSVATQSAAAQSPQSTLDQLRAQGIALASSNQAVQLFHDPRYAQGLIAFVDARNSEEYQAGHIPGAYQFDRFHPELYMGTVLPVCQVAQQVLVYCNGGTCEDSSFAALFLLSAGIGKDKLMVYPGGTSEWRTNGLPIELGERGSGQTSPAGQ